MSDTTSNLRGRVAYHRSQLASLHDGVLALPEGTIGKATAAFGVSDAIDALDRAYYALPIPAAEGQEHEAIDG
jgi:hypothetical protein